jgi:preprotein translocase SecE subunit
MYKPSQGKWVRGMTAVGGLIAGLLLAQYAFDQLQSVGSSQESSLRMWLQATIPTAMLAGCLLLTLWAVNSPGPCEFFIATESEMRKVNWSSKKELIGSTKVVVFVVLALSGFLFGVDMFFTWIFSLIGVLPFSLGA